MAQKEEIIILDFYYSDIKEGEYIEITGVRSHSNLPEFKRPIYKIRFKPDNYDCKNILIDLRDIIKKRYETIKEHAVNFMNASDFDL